MHEGCGKGWENASADEKVAFDGRGKKIGPKGPQSRDLMRPLASAIPKIGRQTRNCDIGRALPQTGLAPGVAPPVVPNSRNRVVPKRRNQVVPNSRNRVGPIRGNPARECSVVVRLERILVL